jgi:glycosyltransferase involved in cell wall biosynthesis
MRIVLANKFWYLRGGAERYAFELKRLLERRGHEVVPFAMRDEKNEASEYARFFVSPVRTDALRYDLEGLRAAGRMLWSFEARRKFRALVRETKPDLLHVQNIYHQISPSILAEAKRRNLPAVMTLHDYHLVSPDYSMFKDGRPAPPSRKHPYLSTVWKKSVRGSLLASAFSAFKSWVHEKLRVYDHVARFIAPSVFMKEICVKYGFDEERFEVIPHFIDLEGKTARKPEGDRLLFVGRLSPEKGADLLVRAARLVPETRFIIVGDGPERAKLVKMAEADGLKNFEFKGRLAGELLEREYARAYAVIVPSRSYEVFGLAALEAYAHGKPVIAARIGGIPEVVREGETGLLFEPGSAEDLASRIKELVGSESRAAKLGAAGRALAEKEYIPEKHYERLIRVYEYVSK